MDNLTLIHICSFFGVVFGVFWLANAYFLKKHKLVSTTWGFSNLCINLAFYFHIFINENNHFFCYYLADLFFLSALFFVHLGILKFFKKPFVPYLIIFLFFSSLQTFFRVNENNFSAIFNVSVYMLYVCSSLNYLIIKNLDLKEVKVKWFIVSPIAISFLLMSLRLLALIFNYSLYSDNLTLNNYFNTYVDLGFLIIIVFLNATLLGVVLSSLIIKVNHLANVDALTKAYNRRYLYQLINEYESKQKLYSILVLDIDYFKKINDSFGHDVGDKFLVEFSKIISSTIKNFSNTTFFRLGGEEFCIVFQSVDKTKVQQLSDDIHYALKNHSWACGIQNKPTISIGVTIQEQSYTLKEMLKHSDLALYKAKDNGRNQTVFSYT